MWSIGMVEPSALLVPYLDPHGSCLLRLMCLLLVVSERV
jgi:hypothetical protein